METIKGYVRYEPEMRFTATGKAITTFLLYNTPLEEYSKKLKAVVWGELAERCAEIISKLQAMGNLCIYAKGYWKTRHWTTPEGTERSVNEFTAQQVWIDNEDGSFHDIMNLQVHFNRKDNA